LGFDEVSDIGSLSCHVERSRLRSEWQAIATIWRKLDKREHRRQRNPNLFGTKNCAYAETK
jgi:hypothetical protein